MKILTRLCSKFGSIVEVLKINKTYLLVGNDTLMMRKTESDDEGVRGMKIFVDLLLSQDWEYVKQ